MSEPMKRRVDCASKDYINSQIAGLKEFVASIANEREQNHLHWRDSIRKELESIKLNAKEAAAAALTAIAAAMAASNTALTTAVTSLDRRFEAVNEFRSQLADQQSTFARKSDVDLAMEFVEKATIKAETAAEKRFEGVNQFRAQLADQQATLVRKSEVDLRFEALEKKLDTAVGQLQLNKGREAGVSVVWGVAAVVLSLLISGAGVVVTLLRH